MASQPDQVSSLPLPPVQYVALYSDENIRRGRAPKPPPPIQDMYTMFGRTFNADDAIIRPLESQGIKRLYPQHFDRRKELKKLNQSLLVNFLDLLDILILCPESPKRTEKIDDISILFIHMHHLINEYRPHQARETLRVTLEVQKRQRLETNFRFRKHIQKVCSSVQHALENLPEIKLDTELLTDIEKLLKDESKSEKSNKFDQVTPQDRIMCKIVDDLVASHRSSKQKKN